MLLGAWKHFNDPTFDDLISISDIGPRVAAKIIDYFCNSENVASLEKLLPCLTIINPDMETLDARGHEIFWFANCYHWKNFTNVSR